MEKFHIIKNFKGIENSKICLQSSFYFPLEEDIEQIHSSVKTSKPVFKSW